MGHALPAEYADSVKIQNISDNTFRFVLFYIMERKHDSEIQQEGLIIFIKLIHWPFSRQTRMDLGRLCLSRAELAMSRHNHIMDSL